MKKIIVLLTFALSVTAFAQKKLDPASWSTSIEKVSNNDYILILTAKLKKGWAIYSKEPTTTGPIPTVIKFKPNDKYELNGEVQEVNVVEKYDDVFEIKVKKFLNKAVFKQKIKLKDKAAVIKTDVEFMACNNVRCLPPKLITLEFKVSKK